jgi:hypothetical protein
MYLNVLLYAVWRSICLLLKCILLVIFVGVFCVGVIYYNSLETEEGAIFYCYIYTDVLDGGMRKSWVLVDWMYDGWFFAWLDGGVL